MRTFGILRSAQDDGVKRNFGRPSRMTAQNKTSADSVGRFGRFGRSAEWQIFGRVVVVRTLR